MDKILISGGRSLHGKIQVSGSKNAALPCLFATLLTDEPCQLSNVPDLVDISTTLTLLEKLGKQIKRKKNLVLISKGKNLTTEAPYDLVRRMRASALILGPMLARMGKAAAALPGGCAIGVRPIDIHLDALKSLGAKTNLVNGIVQLEAARLKGTKIRFAFPSVGATENILMAAALSEGKTEILNAAREPEIDDLINCLNAMGAKITGIGTAHLKIEGQKKLRGCQHEIIPDRIEAATYLVAAQATGGSITLEKTCAAHLKCVVRDLEKTGAKISVSKEKNVESIRIQSSKKIRPVSVRTEVYPGFPTDIQAQWMALMALADGPSKIEETIFENRFLHAAELLRMGAKISIRGRKASVRGVPTLLGADVMVSDLRAGAAMVIAGLVAQGKTTIHRVYHLDRGYEKLEIKLRRLGAKVQRLCEK